MVCGVIHSCHTCSMPHTTCIKQWDSMSKLSLLSLDLYNTGELHGSSSSTTTRVTAEHVRGVVGGHDMVCGVIHPCHTWSMPHITLIKQWNSMSIRVPSYLYHYTTVDGHGASSRV